MSPQNVSVLSRSFASQTLHGQERRVCTLRLSSVGSFSQRPTRTVAYSSTSVTFPMKLTAVLRELTKRRESVWIRVLGVATWPDRDTRPDPSPFYSQVQQHNSHVSRKQLRLACSSLPGPCPWIKVESSRGRIVLTLTKRPYNRYFVFSETVFKQTRAPSSLEFVLVWSC